MAYRKRRKRGTWFPVLSFPLTNFGPEATFDIRDFYVSPTPSRNLIAIPVIPDQTVDTEAATDAAFTLRDAVEGQSYVLDRLVGKIQWSVAQRAPSNETSSAWQNIICCTGFAILGVRNEIGDQGSPELPSAEWDPLLAANSDKPWIWRRTWVLANNAAATGQFNDPLFSAPANNAFFSSIQDGPHIDSKSKRRVGRNERLFMIHSVMPADGQDLEVDDEAIARVNADLRVFGHLVKQRNTSVIT